MDILEKLKENNYTFCASNGYTSFESGIQPILNKMKEEPFYFRDLTIADKVIGKASAMLLCYSGVKEIHTILLSKSAIPVLKQNHIAYYYEQITGNILNHKRDGLCPMELTVQEIDDLKQAFDAINKKSLMMKR